MNYSRGDGLMVKEHFLNFGGDRDEKAQFDVMDAA
jgi:hypothetical protein